LEDGPEIPAWAALLGCLGVVALITLVVGGPAVGFFARWVQYVLAAVAVLALMGAAYGWWRTRREA
jgi:hypothetical protein